MESNQTEKTLTADDILLETVEALVSQGEPIGNFKSHYALILACSKIVWGSEQKYSQGVITLNEAKFCAQSLENRKRTLHNLFTDVISDLFMNLKAKEQKR
jgi:hypothetical protein